jgi:hypothetical protein
MKEVSETIKLSDALAEAKLFMIETATELQSQSFKQNATKLTTIGVEFADKFTSLSGRDKKSIALFIAKELIATFTEVKIDETLADTIDVIVDLSRGKFNISKMKEVAEDVTELAGDIKEVIEDAGEHVDTVKSVFQLMCPCK